MGSSIAIVDYCKGNLASVQRGLTDAGYDARITDDPKDILIADGIVLPGVGAFTDAMTTMEATGQADALRRVVSKGVPFLGICLGVHLLFDWGDEGSLDGGHVLGLGVLPGHVERMAASNESGAKYKIPHVGWNSVEQTLSSPAQQRLFAEIPDGEYFYFTHSYCAVPDHDTDIAATSTHACKFVSAVAHNNIYGVQFHPEKSSQLGLRILKNFGEIVKHPN